MSRTDWRWPRRKQRQEQAAERQTFYDSLDLSQKIALCDSRPGKSKRERARLIGRRAD